MRPHSGIVSFSIVEVLEIATSCIDQLHGEAFEAGPKTAWATLSFCCYPARIISVRLLDGIAVHHRLWLGEAEPAGYDLTAATAGRQRREDGEETVWELPLFAADGGEDDDPVGKIVLEPFAAATAATAGARSQPPTELPLLPTRVSMPIPCCYEQQGGVEDTACSAGSAAEERQLDLPRA